MPGMRLDFVKNVSQRAATGKSLPLKQVEAILLYGKPEQRAKVIQKLLPNTYSLCLSKSTHHILITLLEKCDGLVRVQMLYHLRRKIMDLSLSPVGNIIIQEMLTRLPAQQKKEIAEAFILNADANDFRRLCEHQFGNHVAQKLMEYSSSREVVEERFLLFISSLALHPYGQRVVVKYIDNVDDGWRRVLKGIFESTGGKKKNKEHHNNEENEEEEEKEEVDEDQIALLFGVLSESMTASAIIRHPMVPVEIKDGICAHLCEYAEEYLRPQLSDTTKQNGNNNNNNNIKNNNDKNKEEEEEEYALPDFGEAPAPQSLTKSRAENSELIKKNPISKKEEEPLRQHHTYVTLFEFGDTAHRRELWFSLENCSGLVEYIISHKTAVAVAVAAFKTLPEAQDRILSHLFVPGESILSVAQDPVRTILLRAVIEVRHDAISNKLRNELAEAAFELSQNPFSSPVLQKLVEYCADDTNCVEKVFNSLKPKLHYLTLHSTGSYLVQSLIQFSNSALREEIVKHLLIAFSDLHEMLATAQGSRVMQKLIIYASDEAVVTVIEKLLEDAAKELDDATEDNDNNNNNNKKKSNDYMDKENIINNTASKKNNKKEESEEESKNEEEEEEDDGDEENKDEEIKKAKLSPQEQRRINRTRLYAIKSHAIASYALHCQACYVIQSILRECRGRQLEPQRKQLMNELKPFVFDLAVSPWAGRVVLDAMMQCGSAQLTTAMKNVVFLRAEEWLSDVSEKKKRRGGGLDPTMRQTLRRGREEINLEKTKHAEHSEESERPRKKIYRSLKK